MTNTYQQYNGELFRSTYGNGHYVNYFYDNLHRLQGISKISGGSTQISAWEYNSFGNVSKLVDGSAGLTTYFNYDSIGRISSFARSDSFAGTVTYDTKNRVSSAQYRTSVGSRSTQYTYDNATGLVTAAHTDGISWSNATTA